MAIRNGVLCLLAATVVALPACVPLTLLDGLTQAFATPSDSSLEHHTIEAAGHTWVYALWAPESHPADQPAPVVLVLHGTGETGDDPLLRNGWADKAAESGFIVVAPTAQPMAPASPANYLTNPTVWNAGQPYLTDPRRAIDDLAFFDALLDELGTRHKVDTERIFVAGHSGGGGMAFRLAAERADRVRGIAVIASPCWLADPQPAVPVPTLFLAGTQDPIYPLAGGTQNLVWFQRTTPAAAETLATWAAAVGCLPAAQPLDDPVMLSALGLDPPGDSTADPATTLETGTGGDSPANLAPGTNELLDRDRVQAVAYPCPQGPPRLVAIFLEGHGHRWPGGRTPELPESLIGPDNPPLNAVNVIWRFFGLHGAEGE
jgi:polyhydroxybutyrate depolymerase